MTAPFPQSYWLEPDRILCGEYPRHKSDTVEQDKMKAILEAGVRVFVDLTEEDELAPYVDIARKAASSIGVNPDSLEFYRYPIRDVSVPRDPAEMRAVLRRIRLARHAKKVVYLHCWGGVGRTGTVAGCLLRDLFGCNGSEALARFQESWKHCAKSAHREAPETEEQRGYIRSFNPVESSAHQRVRDAVIGAAVGDALGVPVEFAGRAARKHDPVVDMREFGTHKQRAGTWSDDSSMIFATMSALSHAGTFSPEAVMDNFAAWKNEAVFTPHGQVFDIGNATSDAIRKYTAGTPPFECGGTGDWSNGNGSLMRILPIGLAFANDPDLYHYAQQCSALTHAHERSRFCCVFYCLVVSELLHEENLFDATEFAWHVMDARFDFTALERERFEALHPDKLFQRDEDSIESTGHVIDTLEAALWVNAQNDNFADAVLHAVNLGDDTDTTGCVAGGLAGLIYGEKRIPEEWRKVLVGQDRISEWCEKFAGWMVNGRRQAIRAEKDG